jgi:hypothetical protein
LYPEMRDMEMRGRRSNPLTVGYGGYSVCVPKGPMPTVAEQSKIGGRG